MVDSRSPLCNTAAATTPPRGRQQRAGDVEAEVACEGLAVLRLIAAAVARAKV
jgi:hypothetical protein